MLPKLTLCRWQGRGWEATACKILDCFPNASVGYTKRLATLCVCRSPARPSDDTVSAIDCQVKAAKSTLTRTRSLKKMMTVLQGQGLATANEQVIQQLESLHPDFV